MAFSLYANQFPVTIGIAVDHKTGQKKLKAAKLGALGKAAERFREVTLPNGNVLLRLVGQPDYLYPFGGQAHGGYVANQLIVAWSTKQDIMEHKVLATFIFTRQDQEDGGRVYQHKHSLDHSGKTLYLAPDAEKRLVLSTEAFVWRTELPADPVPVDPVVAELRARIAELEAQLADRDRRLAQIVTFVSGGGQ